VRGLSPCRADALTDRAGAPCPAGIKADQGVAIAG
jgi:hypothetical protein